MPQDPATTRPTHAARPLVTRLHGAGLLAAPMLLVAWLLASTPALASGPAIFRDADLAQGEALIRQHRCAQCHAEKMGGDGSAIYRPMGRVNTAGLLRGMVEQCNSVLNLQMWPEEVTSVAAVLNRDHYRFRD